MSEWTKHHDADGLWRVSTGGGAVLVGHEALADTIIADHVLAGLAREAAEYVKWCDGNWPHQLAAEAADWLARFDAASGDEEKE